MGVWKEWHCNHFRFERMVAATGTFSILDFSKELEARDLLGWGEPLRCLPMHQ